MSKLEQSVRQNVSLPIETGLQSKDAEKERFFAIANRLSESTDPAERQRLKEELARMTFGD